MYFLQEHKHITNYNTVWKFGESFF